MTSLPASARIGTAGWSIPRANAASFPDVGSHLERYGAVFDAVEINSSFDRPHRRSTYERWAASVPDDFRFALKIPKVITHERRLKEAGEELDRFLSDLSGLGPKVGPLLVQLPPSLAFQHGVSDVFLGQLRDRFSGSIVCEPRHASWIVTDVDALLRGLRIARVAADPAPVPGAGEPGGWKGLSYFRLHGSPRIYYSPYETETLVGIASRIVNEVANGTETWCIFDNTAAFAATGDALTTRRLTKASPLALESSPQASI